MKDSDGYAKVASVDADTRLESPGPSPTASVSSPANTTSANPSIQFAKAAFVFQDKLNNVRKKHAEAPQETALEALPPSQSGLQDNTTEGDSTIKGDDDAPEPEDPIAARRLRILRFVQSTLTSLLSIAIAALQAKAYASFQRTKDTPGAWPTHPNLLPTILLIVIAVLASAADLSMLLAYLFRSRAETFFEIATKSYNTLACVKGMSYVLVSVVCRGGFNYGNSTGQNNDLWSWTCSPAADEFDSVTQAGANCDGQTAAWYIALVQIGIEGIGVFGTIFINRRSKKANGKRVDSNDLAGELETIATWGSELEKTLGGTTPK